MTEAPKPRLIPELHRRLPDVFQLLDKPEAWDSLIVNRRKPYTYRVHTKIDGYRFCLHKFDPCHTHEAFPHPHPWPGAFLILAGRYQMWLGRSKDRQDKDPVTISHTVMAQYGCYEIVDPLVWHAVVPMDTTWTVMLNESPWPADVAHEAVRTTAGKDLDKMPEANLLSHLDTFKTLFRPYITMPQPASLLGTPRIR